MTSRTADTAGVTLDPFDLTGRIALVTGSSRGIGRAIAEQLAYRGARVVISSRKAPACKEVADAIVARHGPRSALAIAANISSAEDVDRIVAEIEHELGEIDILVCNAASNPYFGPSLGLEEEMLRKLLENNVVANHRLIRRVTPGMAWKGGGAIILVASVGAGVGSAMIGGYNLTKAADLQMARNFAVELGPDGIRVNCVSPGLIRTDFSRAIWSDPVRESAVCAGTPMRRIGDPDDVAGAVVFLASPAGRYVTGQDIVIDGGQRVMSPVD